MDKETVIENRYRIDKPLGQGDGGSTGRVYLALDMQVEQKVAVKVLRPIFTSDRELVNRLRAAFSDARALRHPSIVRYRDFIVCGDQIVIVSDYVEGRTLEEVLEKDGPLNPKLTKECMLELCAAMHLAHSSGVGHYDLTRRNVMLADGGGLRICDFALSRLLKDWLLRKAGGKKAQDVNRTRLMEYLAPEQKLAKPLYSITCDIYAAGILLEEMQTCKYPDLAHQTRRASKKAERSATESAPAVQFSDKMPNSWDYIVRKSLNPKPWERWETFIIVSYVLEGKVQMRRRSAEVTSAQPIITNRLLNRRIIGFTLVALIAIGAVFGVLKLVSVMFEDTRPPHETLSSYLSGEVPEKNHETSAKGAQKPIPSSTMHINAAKELAAKGDLDAAEAEVKTALDIAGDHSGAAEVLKIIQKRRTIESLFEKARLHIRAFRYVRASALLDEIAEMDPGNVAIPKLRAVVEKGQRISSLLASARRAFDNRFFTTPKEKSAYAFCMKVLEQEPGNKEAKSIIAKMAEAYIELGDVSFGKGDFSSAALYYSRALSVSPKNGRASKQLKLSRERAREAKREAEEASTETETETQPTEPDSAPGDGSPTNDETE
ncbi:protein kinase [bacterium]|nr:protein kinase [bacterium]